MDDRWQGAVEIAAPVERVFAYLADFPRHCEWAQTLERMELQRAGDGAGVGARYKTFERQAFQNDRKPRGPLPEKAFKGTTICEVTELSPPRRIAWKAHPSPRMGINTEMAFDLAPHGDGGTVLTQTIRMRQTWLAERLVRVMMKLPLDEVTRRAHAQYQASLENIKAILEEGDGAGGAAAVVDGRQSAG